MYERMINIEYLQKSLYMRPDTHHTHSMNVDKGSDKIYTSSSARYANIGVIDYICHKFQKVSKYDQEMRQKKNVDQPMAPQGRDTELRQPRVSNKQLALSSSTRRL